MKNHIAFKFIAIALCALSLLVAAASAVGIAVLASSDLYEEDLAVREQESRQQVIRSAAYDVVGIYASTHLGKCPEQLARGFFESSENELGLKDGYWFYTISDETGEELESTFDGKRTMTSYEIREAISYLELVSGPVETGYRYYEGDETTFIAPSSDPTVEDASQFRLLCLDYATGGYQAYEVKMPDTSAYTVTIYLAENAFVNEETWTLIRFLVGIRDQLIYLTAGGLVAFAACAVYLCCAAGKKPGGQELQPGGLNRLPLDLYAVLTVGMVILLAQLARYASYVISDMVLLAVELIALMAYGGCLMIVGFCFACAAQFKMGWGWWLRRTVAGWSLIHLLRLARWIFRWIFGRVIPSLWGLVKRLWACVVKALGWCGRKIAGFFRWILSRVARAYGLLPLIWQWLLVGTVVFLIAVISGYQGYYDTGWVLFAAVLAILVILYGAYSFGLLMEAAKRMRKGDLETKVHDRLLIGSFREFAGDMNALADVVEEAARQQMKSERMRSELITNVSHDIKTPLTSIINYIDLLEKPHTPEEERQYLEVLERQSHRLKKLIVDLIEMSKASTGNVPVELGSVDAVEAVNQALGEYADKLTAAGLTPMFQQPGKPVMIHADGRLVWRVLSNLMGNAVKYALPGTRLYLDVVREADRVLISMKNISREGLNVTAEELMERFVRGDASRNTEGSGLGLNIAKSLMELQHGELKLVVDGDLFKATLIFPAEKRS